VNAYLSALMTAGSVFLLYTRMILSAGAHSMAAAVISFSCGKYGLSIAQQGGWVMPGCQHVVLCALVLDVQAWHHKKQAA
jgi:hypothetical protein